MGTPSVGPCRGEVGTPLWAHAGVRWVHLCRPCRGEVGTPLWAHAGVRRVHLCRPCRTDLLEPSGKSCRGRWREVEDEGVLS